MQIHVDITDDMMTLLEVAVSNNDTCLNSDSTLIHQLCSMIAEDIEDDPDHYAIQDELNELDLGITLSDDN